MEVDFTAIDTALLEIAKQVKELDEIRGWTETIRNNGQKILDRLRISREKLNSGEATDRLGSITKQGSAMARFILGQLVLHALRRDA
jgi:hypothetical protein